jgi:hypothetical protein
MTAYAQQLALYTRERWEIAFLLVIVGAGLLGFRAVVFPAEHTPWFYVASTVFYGSIAILAIRAVFGMMSRAKERRSGRT